MLRLIDELVQAALKEDAPWGDLTSEVLIDSSVKGGFSVMLKENGVVAGLPVAERAFLLTDPELVWTPLTSDGTRLEKGSELARVEGSSQKILTAERVALNFLQRLSGIATLTDLMVRKIREVSQETRLTDTRKTTPGLRYLEKYAVRMGGGCSHRHSLSDAVMIKDNHLAILEENGLGLKEALLKIKRSVPHTAKIEVEVDHISQIPEVLEAGADIILLDNMSVSEMEEAVELIKGRALTEASGGVSLETAAGIAATKVDYISCGSLTHSAPSLDISLDYR